MDKEQRQLDHETKREKKNNRDLRITKGKWFFGGGVVLGAAAFIIAFSNGLIVTGSNAEGMARDAANKANVAALTPYCVENFKASRDYTKNLAALEKTSTWSRGSYIGDGPWSDGMSSSVNRACADAILADVEASKKAAEAKASPAKGT